MAAGALHMALGLRALSNRLQLGVLLSSRFLHGLSNTTMALGQAQRGPSDPLSPP